MKQELYAFFYSKVKSVSFSIILTNVYYTICIFLYSIRAFFTKSHIVNLDDSLEVVSNIYPKPNYTIEFSNEPIDAGIDVSVIIPVYNHVDAISNCIESVLNQKTNYRFELILVDDGSTDGASDICDDYKNNDDRVRVIHQKNSGIGGARNTGLNHAKGKYIQFVDCDDYVHDDFIETMLNKAYETNADIVICGYTLVKKQKGKTITKREILYSNKNLEGYKDPEDMIMNYQGLPWNKIYKREVFNTIRYIKGFWYEDTITHFLIYRICKSFSYIDKSLYDYMWYEDNFTHTQTKVVPKSIERYWLVEVMKDESERIGLPLDRCFYKTILRHFGRILFSGVFSFDEYIKEAVFVSASDFLKRYKPQEKYYLTFFEKQLEKALLTRNIAAWELACKYI